jgi:hypothetical protein
MIHFFYVCVSAVNLHVSPSTVCRFSRKSCFFLRAYGMIHIGTHAHTNRKSQLTLPCMQLISPSIIMMTIPALSSLHSLLLLPSTPSHGQGQCKQTKEDDQTNGQRFPPRRKSTSKTKQRELSGPPEQKNATFVSFGDRPIFRFKIVDYDGGSQHPPPRRRDKASSLDSSLSESISKAIYCLLNGWGVNWCD